jgi:hypothetical protein
LENIGVSMVGGTMWEKLVGSIFLILSLWACIQAFYYTHLVWFRTEKYLEKLRNDNDWPGNLQIAKDFRRSRFALPAARLITLFVFLLCIPMFVLASIGLFVIWFQVP